MIMLLPSLVCTATISGPVHPLMVATYTMFFPSMSMLRGSDREQNNLLTNRMFSGIVLFTKHSAHLTSIPNIPSEATYIHRSAIADTSITFRKGYQQRTLGQEQALSLREQPSSTAFSHLA
jgi:hypothetical protein